MAVDPRAKGARGETQVRDKLRELTGLNFERVPGSGALDPKHMLKGDLYIPNERNKYCIEVKNYEEDHINSTLLTGKTPKLIEFWEQTIRESAQVSKIPLLIFKFNRSKMFCAFKTMPSADYRYLFLNINKHEFYVALLDDFIRNDQPEFI